MIFTPTIFVAQMPPKPPHTAANDLRYGWGHSNDVIVMVNGKRLAQRANIRDNRVQVPMRAIFEVLGAFVTWSPDSRMVTAKKGDKMVSLIVNQNFAYNPKPVRLDYPPRLWRGHVMIPLRFVSETFGARVSFNRQRKIATVYLPAQH